MRQKSVFLTLVCALSATGAADLAPARAAEILVAPEQNPPGDIPDSQVFITYSGAGFSLRFPRAGGATTFPTVRASLTNTGRSRSGPAQRRSQH